MKIAGPAVTDWAAPVGISVICYLLFVIRFEGPQPTVTTSETDRHLRK
jgi:hypothetical protein